MSPIRLGPPLEDGEDGEWRCSCCGSSPCRNPRSYAYGVSVGTVAGWWEKGTPEPTGYLPEELLTPKEEVLEKS